MATKSPEAGPAAPTFETAIGRLETLVEQMESDKMPLEQLLVSYEEGLKLVKLCSEKLTDAEKRIEIIARNAAGKPVLVDFDPGKAKAVAPVENPNPAGSVSLF